MEALDLTTSNLKTVIMANVIIKVPKTPGTKYTGEPKNNTLLNNNPAHTALLLRKVENIDNLPGY